MRTKKWQPGFDARARGLGLESGWFEV